MQGETLMLLCFGQNKRGIKEEENINVEQPFRYEEKEKTKIWSQERHRSRYDGEA